MNYGITTTGFTVKPLDQCKSELDALFRATYGAGFVLDPSSPEGQLIGILAGRESEIWDLAGAVYSSRDPDQAGASALESICSITGTIRAPAKASKVTATLGGTSGTLVPTGSQVSASGTGVKFATLVDAILAAVAAWAGTTVYAAGARVALGGSIYEATIGGTSAATGGPTGTGTAIVDGTVTWRYLGTGTGAISVACSAVGTGPKIAPSRTLAVIETPVSGWSWVTNALDAIPGADIETDAALRARRIVELFIAGSATPDAVRAQVLKVTGVTGCTVLENPTDSVDGNGLPAHSIRCLVSGGSDADVAKAIWGAKAGGIASDGTTSIAVLDSQGASHTVKFSRPTDVPIYAAVTLTKDASKYPADGDSQVQQAIVKYALASLGTDSDVIARAFFPSVFAISGVLDIVHFYIGTAASPTSEANIVIAATQIARFDSSRITVA